jgi:dTDP-glucose 4,6-dehydratase
VNLGNPDEITILEFAKEIQALTHAGSKIIHKPLPEDDPTQRQPDISRARKILGWTPVVHRSEGLKITYDYFKGLPENEWYITDHQNFEEYIKR